MNAELSLDPPETFDRRIEQAEDIAIAAAHQRLSLPADVKQDEDAEVVFTGPKRAIVYLALAVEVELP